MKKIIFILLIAVIGCNKKNDDVTIPNACSVIDSYNDTITVTNYKLALISLIDSAGRGSLEVIDKNKNNINGSINFSINLVQLQNGNNCWETSNIAKATGSSVDSYDGTYNGIPAWAKNSNTKVTIKLTISGSKYFLTDEQANK